MAKKRLRGSSLVEQPVGLGEVEHERLLDQQRAAGLDHPQRRGEVILVRQAQRHQVGRLDLEHPVEVEVGRGVELACTALGLLARPSDDGAQVDVWAPGEHSGVLAPPPLTGPDDRDTQPLRHVSLRATRVCTVTTTTRNSPLTTCWW